MTVSEEMENAQLISTKRIQNRHPITPERTLMEDLIPHASLQQYASLNETPHAHSTAEPDLSQKYSTTNYKPG